MDNGSWTYNERHISLDEVIWLDNENGNENRNNVENRTYLKIVLF